MMKTRFIFVLLSLLVALSASQTLDAFKDVVLESVERTVDLSSQLCKIETTIEVKNEKDTPLKDFYFAIPSELSESLRLFVVKDHYNTSKIYDYSIVENLKIKNDHGATLYKLELESPIKPGQTKMFKISEIHWGRMIPLPKQINIFDDQKLVFEDNSYFFSPYTVLSQTTNYRFGGSLITFSDSEGRNKGQSLEYRFTNTVPGFEKRPNRLHFENNTPFVVFREVTKTIEVSHWGNINIQESYKLANEGAEFKGEFSRIDFSTQSRNTGKSAMRGMLAKYPVHAWGMHYRDEVGNISTSRAYRDNNNVNLQIQPRFAILGGWSHNWDISYNLETSHYLFAKENNASSFVLKQDFGFPFENILAEKYTLKIILPEGAENLKFDLPFKIDSDHKEKTFSYLDYQGRPTLVLEKKNVLDYHNKQITVTYDFDAKNLVFKAGLLFSFFLAVFTVLIIIGRIDFAFKQKKE